MTGFLITLAAIMGGTIFFGFSYRKAKSEKAKKKDFGSVPGVVLFWHANPFRHCIPYGRIIKGG